MQKMPNFAIVKLKTAMIINSSMTMKDIAQELGTSVATVSRALKD